MNNNNDNRNYGAKQSGPVTNNSMVPDFDAAKKVGEEMNHMKSNEELNKEGLLEDPIQASPESARQVNDKESQVKLKRPGRQA